MAIQGIISGFADPNDLGRNVILVGRGPVYVLLVDGFVCGEPHDDLDLAQERFRAQANACQPWWVEVRGLSTAAVGASQVTEVGCRTAADALHDEGAEIVAQQAQRNRG